MKVFAISDLHISGSAEKPMSIFGDNWDNHWDNIKTKWCNNVQEQDIVLIPGDISWAMTLEEATPCLLEIGQLPGIKIMIKGNHDYWWSSISRIREILGDNFYALQNDAIKIGKYVIAGTRGWICPNSNDYKKADEKIYIRECARLEMSILAAQKLIKDDDELIIMMHYPPYAVDKEKTGFTELIQKSKAKCVVFGHIHSIDRAKELEGIIGNTEYKMVSCDYIDFNPIKI